MRTTISGHPDQDITLFADLYNVKLPVYGAIGDGSSHTASSVGYTTLGALQAKYSFATALTNQMDWLGAQAAVNAASTAGGGQVLFPSGTYKFDRPLILPINVDFFVPNGSSVDIRGSGPGSTFLTPTADFGANSALVSCGPPSANWSDISGANTIALTASGAWSSVTAYVTNNAVTFGGASYVAVGSSTNVTPGTDDTKWQKNTGSGRYAALGSFYSKMSDITLKNTLGIAMSYGTPVNISGTPVAMDGLMWGARMELHNIRVEGFRAGINAVGDHTPWSRVYCQNNTYGVWMADMNKYCIGDLTWTDCFFTSNMIAGVWISKNTYLNVNQTGELYMGGQPYAFLAEGGISDNYGQAFAADYCPMMVNSQYQFIQSEWIGNGLIWDDGKTVSNGTVAAGSRNIVQVTIDGLYTSWDSTKTYTTGGRGSKAWIGVNTINGLEIRSLYSGSLSGGASGQVAGIHINDCAYAGGPFRITGDIDSIIGTYNNVEFIHAPAIPNGKLIELVSNGWSGGVTCIQASLSGLAIGVAIENVNYAGGQPATGSVPLLGINMQTWTTDPNGKFTIIADRSRTLKVATSGTVTVGQYVQPNAFGLSVTYTSGQKIGFVVNVDGAHNIAYVTLRLQ